MNTITVKTSDLTGPALDWAVAECEQLSPFSDGISWIVEVNGRYLQLPRYSTDWSQGGPIIEREKIKIFPNVGGTWSVQIRHEKNHPLVAHKVLDGWTNRAGPTPLIAAMRCYVASKLGDTVEIPKELSL